MADRSAELTGRWSPTRVLHGFGLALAVALAAAVALSVVGVLPEQLVRIPTDSMAPTLPVGAQVVLDKSRRAPPLRGELIAFTDPDGTALLVKRVAAVAGDAVGIEDGVLVVNGRAVDEPYTDRSRLDGVYIGPVTVPAGRLYVLGDNRVDSVDSRTFGPIPEQAVVGRIVFRLWPAPGPP